MKVLIITHLEGVAGVVSFEDETSPAAGIMRQPKNFLQPIYGKSIIDIIFR